MERNNNVARSGLEPEQIVTIHCQILWTVALRTTRNRILEPTIPNFSLCHSVTMATKELWSCFVPSYPMAGKHKTGGRMTCGSSTAWLCPGNLAEKMGNGSIDGKDGGNSNDKKYDERCHWISCNLLKTPPIFLPHVFITRFDDCQNAHLRLFGAEARIDWAHPVLALDELEQLVRESPEQSLGRKFHKKYSGITNVQPSSKNQPSKILTIGV